MMACRRAWLAVLAIVFVLLFVDQIQGVQRDPYQVLGVRRSATQQEITKAFRRLSRQYHPDKNPSKDATSKFQEISAAYDYLTDPARQSKPWEWDFADADSSARHSRRRRGGFSPDAAYDAFHESYQFVLDLDPVRMWQLATSWIEKQAAKYNMTVGPLWDGPVDRSVCRVLESGWKLPQLLEPILLFGSNNKYFIYEPGQWRTWVSSGLLLELSFWVGKQTPCLQYQTSSCSAADVAADSSKTDTDYERLVELQQQLHLQRRLRQQQLHAAKSSSGDSSSSTSRSRIRRNITGRGSSVVLDGFDVDTVQLQLLQGRLLWWVLLLSAAYLLRKDKQLLAVGFALMASGIWSAWWGFASQESAVEGLQNLLESHSWQGWLVGCWYVTASLFLCLLLPVVAAGLALLSVTWLWAAVSCVSLAMTPCVSRFGFAIWIALQLWSLSRGELVRGVVLAGFVCYVLYKRPNLLWWWVRLIFSPVLFAYHMVRIWGILQLHWWGLHIPGAKANRPQPVAAQQRNQQANGAAGPAAAEAADGKTSSTSASAGAPAAAAAAGPSSNASKPSVKRRVVKGAVLTVFAIFRGPWWPASFGALDLACTCHWWIRLLGWTLPNKVLQAGAVSCKLCFAAMAAALAAAAFGVPTGWLTAAKLVQLGLLRVGIGIGTLWVLYNTFDDVVQFLNPKGYQQKQRQQQIMRERARRVQEELQKVQQRREQQQQQQQQAAARQQAP